MPSSDHDTPRRVSASHCAVIVLLTLVGAPQLSAHHAIGAIYDSSKRVTVEGAVREFQFINPHPILIIEVTQGGKTAEWRLEMDNRFELIDEGMNAESLKAGDKVVATGSVSRTNTQAIYLMRLDRPADGFRYEQVGSRPRVRRP